jgi:hypothetical protein
LFVAAMVAIAATEGSRMSNGTALALNSEARSSSGHILAPAPMGTMRGVLSVASVSAIASASVVARMECLSSGRREREAPLGGGRAKLEIHPRGGGLLLDRYNFADVLALEDDRVAASSAPFPGCVMVNQLPTDEPSSACALCGQPFNVHNNHVYAWRSTGGKLYCSEFCADDEDEEARFPYSRRA